MCRFKLIVILLFTLPLSGSCGKRESGFDFSQHDLTIVSNGDGWSADAADYLYMHLSKRIGENKSPQLQRRDHAVETFKGGVVYMEIVPDLEHDYQVKNEIGTLSLFARNRETMVWLSYMLIDYISRFHEGIDVADLVPSYLDFRSQTGKFAMRYREPHTLPNTDLDYAGVLGTHAVDRDWGIWGHHMQQVFRGKVSDSVYAWVDGKRNKEQFCFSAPQTFDAVDDFIMDGYGSGEKIPMRFMITPNDNGLVCTCSECRKLGNTKENATGAVVDLINRLARKYPHHHFYTIAYLTTMKAPQVLMEENTGVFVSTIDLPKQAVLDPKVHSVRTFTSTLNAWREKTQHIYLWDYISNFDDYMTPYPVLRRLQNQLVFFGENGVSGMFLNGGGYDYVPLDDMKTYVMAALLQNPSLEVEPLVKSYLQRFYPLTGALLHRYYMAVENESFAKNTDIPIYLSFREASRLYFKTAEFKQLYEQLMQVLPDLIGAEYERVDLLLTAWSYTYLQILYHEDYATGSPPQTVLPLVEKVLARLAGHDRYDMENYKETQGKISTYIREWRDLLKIDRSAHQSFDKLSVSELGKTAEELEDKGLLGDGVLGFASDFNQGWFLTPKNIVAEGEISGKSEEIEKVVIRFLINPRHRMLAPKEVEVFKEGDSQGKFTEKKYKYRDNVAYIECPVSLKSGEKLQIKIQKSEQITNSIIACDEIQLL